MPQSVVFEDIQDGNFDIAWDLTEEDELVYENIVGWEIAVKDPDSGEFLWDDPDLSFSFNKDDYPIFNDRIEISLDLNNFKIVNGSYVGVRYLLQNSSYGETTESDDGILLIRVPSHGVIHTGVVVLVDFGKIFWGNKSGSITGKANGVDVDATILSVSKYNPTEGLLFIPFSNNFTENDTYDLEFETDFGKIETTINVGSKPNKSENSNFNGNLNFYDRNE